MEGSRGKVGLDPFPDGHKAHAVVKDRHKGPCGEGDAITGGSDLLCDNLAGQEECVRGGRLHGLSVPRHDPEHDVGQRAVQTQEAGHGDIGSEQLAALVDGARARGSDGWEDEPAHGVDVKGGEQRRGHVLVGYKSDRCEDDDNCAKAAVGGSEGSQQGSARLLPVFGRRPRGLAALCRLRH